MAQSPYWLFVLLVLTGVVGSVFTLTSILIIFVKELRSGTLW